MIYGPLSIDVFGKELTDYILEHFQKESGGEIIKLQEIIRQTDRYRFVCRVEKPGDGYIVKCSVEQAFYLSEGELIKMKRNRKLDDLNI